jgi:hypothetical protein
MRLTTVANSWGAALFVAVAVTAVVFPTHNRQTQAAGDSSRGEIIDVSAAVGGRYATPSAVWADPCDPPAEYVTILEPDALPTGSTVATSRTAADGVIERAIATYCWDPETSAIVTNTLRIYWIGAPDPADLVPAVFAYLPDYLDPPTVEWPNMSPEHGWLFVKVSMDFRVNNLKPITLTATATNVLGTATASVTATPDRLAFVSGEGGSTECSAEEAREAYVSAAYGSCSYRYVNSSAIAGGAFSTRTTMFWAITSDPFDPGQPTELETFTTQSLAVSEVQAVVTCTGSGC